MVSLENREIILTHIANPASNWKESLEEKCHLTEEELDAALTELCEQDYITPYTQETNAQSNQDKAARIIGYKLTFKGEKTE